MDIEYLESLPKERYDELYDMLKKISIPKLRTASNQVRKALPDKSRSTAFGYVLQRIGRKYQLSAITKKYPEIYMTLKTLINNIVPDFEYTSIQVNHNVICNPHKDKNNIGKSVIISFGEYTGCKFVIEDVIYDTYHQPICFDGSKLSHWNTDDLVGDKYSIVYYTSKHHTDESESSVSFTGIQRNRKDEGEASIKRYEEAYEGLLRNPEGSL